MTIIASQLAELIRRGPGRQVVEEAKGLLAQIILPRRITGRVIEKYIRKALIVRAWHRLGAEERALLILTRRLPRVKSPVLTSVLRRILLKIEMLTVRGQALFYGIILTMQSTLGRILRPLINIPRLLAIGISYLNNPPHMRIYG